MKFCAAIPPVARKSPLLFSRISRLPPPFLSISLHISPLLFDLPFPMLSAKLKTSGKAGGRDPFVWASFSLAGLFLLFAMPPPPTRLPSYSPERGISSGSRASECHACAGARWVKLGDDGCGAENGQDRCTCRPELCCMPLSPRAPLESFFFKFYVAMFKKLSRTATVTVSM